MMDEEGGMVSFLRAIADLFEAANVSKTLI